MKIRPLHLNVPQLKIGLVDATETYVVAGRGVGKTSGIIAPWEIRRAQEMPRSSGGIVGATFQQLLVRTLPPMLAMWKKMGYEQDRHFVIGREPSEKFKRLFKWEGPITKPLDSKYAIYWFNGSANVLISQDRVGSSNGLSLQYVAGDEAKLLNKQRFDEEVIPTLRGERAKFGKCTGYGGILFTTDMPTTAKAKWILDMAAEMDVDQITQIMSNQLLYNLRQRQYMNAEKSEKLSLHKALQVLEKRLYSLRLGHKNNPEARNRIISKYYLEASAMDNLDVLGPQYLKRMKGALTDLQYRTSILNQRLNKIEGGFYPNFKPEFHGTDWFDYHYLDSFIGRTSIEEDSRQDDGMDKGSPLDVGCDYGVFNCMVTGQRVGMEYRLFRGFHRYQGEGLLQDVVKDFCKYYKHYPTKVVNYYYDHTAIGGNANTEATYAQSVIDTFRGEGWQVNEMYMSRTVSPDIRYKVFDNVFSEKDPEALKVRYSRSGLGKWEIAMGNADVKQGTKGVEKNKNPERDKDADQAETTHYTDAGDNLLFYVAASNQHSSGITPISSIN